MLFEVVGWYADPQQTFCDLVLASSLEKAVLGAVYRMDSPGVLVAVFDHGFEATETGHFAMSYDDIQPALATLEKELSAGGCVRDVLVCEDCRGVHFGPVDEAPDVLPLDLCGDLVERLDPSSTVPHGECRKTVESRASRAARLSMRSRTTSCARG